MNGLVAPAANTRLLTVGWYFGDRPSPPRPTGKWIHANPRSNCSPARWLTSSRVGSAVAVSVVDMTATLGREAPRRPGRPPSRRRRWPPAEPPGGHGRQPGPGGGVTGTTAGRPRAPPPPTSRVRGPATAPRHARPRPTTSP